MFEWYLRDYVEVIFPFYEKNTLFFDKVLYLCICMYTIW